MLIVVIWDYFTYLYLFLAGSPAFQFQNGPNFWWGQHLLSKLIVIEMYVQSLNTIYVVQGVHILQGGKHETPDKCQLQHLASPLKYSFVCCASGI